MIDLITKTDQETTQKALQWIEENLDHGFYENDEFTLGDEISFMGGFNDDILYKSKIIGIDTNGWLYLIWDCYWFPIDPNDENRKIQKLCTQSHS